MKNVLLINDLVGIGNITTTAMMPILSYLGFPTYNLPTSLVSNNFGYGKYAMLDTSDYLRQTFPIWDKLGFRFDAIITGFIPSDEQAEMISQFCAKQAAGGAGIYVDPVMGDGGKAYEGLSAETMVGSMRRMLGVADVCFPNYTEACLLTGTPYKEEGISSEEMRGLVDAIRECGVKSVIITSLKVDGKAAVAGYKHENGEYFLLHYEELPLIFSGTGDVFAAILTGHLLKGEDLKASTQKAIDGVYNFMRLNKDEKDPYNGLPVAKYLGIL